MPSKHASAPKHTCPYAAALSDDEEGSYVSHMSHGKHGRPTPDSGSPSSGSLGGAPVGSVLSSDVLSLARSKCPAFSTSCPFRGVTSSSEIRSIMKQVPPSHFPSSSSVLQAVVSGVNVDRGGNNTTGSNKSGEKESSAATPFQLAMEHVHRVSNWLEGKNPSNSSNGNDESCDSTESRIKRDSYIIHGGCPFRSFHKNRSSSSYTSTNLAKAMEDYSLAAIMGRMADSFDEFDGDGKREGGANDEIERNSSQIVQIELNQKPTNKHQNQEQHDQPIGQNDKTPLSSTSSATPTTSTPPPDPTATLTTPPPGSKLSHALKIGTAQSHTSAENVHFVKNFVRGIIDRELYMELVTGLYHVYRTLEQLLEVHGPVYFPTLHFGTELARLESLKEDMEFWHGVGWENKPECSKASPAVQDYIERMEEVGRIDPLLLLSHAYTRYLGDLSGGKVLSRIARRALNLGSHVSYDGLQFYHFEGIPSAKLFKDQYRMALDTLGTTLNDDQINRLVAEANVAFALNMRVFEELDVSGGVEGARVRDVREALVYYDKVIEEQNLQNSGEGIMSPREGGWEDSLEGRCPFGFVGGPNPHAYSSRGLELKNSDRLTLPSSSITKVAAVDAIAKTNEASGGRCPWPFVFFHDPVAGMRDWQTWFVMGIALCWTWHQFRLALADFS